MLRLYVFIWMDERMDARSSTEDCAYVAGMLMGEMGSIDCQLGTN